MKIFNKLFFLLSHNERKHAVLLLMMTVIMTLLDMIGIASILPFITVLTNPSLIETNIFLNIMYQTSNRFGVETNQEFLFFLGALVFLILITSLAFKALTTYLQVRFVYMREYSIGKRLVEGYLHQPYAWFLSRNSSDLGKTILSEVSQVISNGIKPLMELVAKSILTIAIITLLSIVDPKLTLIVGLSISFAYLVIFYFVRNLLNRSGKERLKSNQLRFIAVSEAFSAIKEVIIRGLEKFYIQSFSNSSQNYARNIALSQVIAQLPRFILEAISFGGILLIIIYKMTQSGNFNNTLPVISLYVFAGYRLMPALQQIYNSLTQLAFIGPSIDKLHSDLKSLKPLNINYDEDVFTFNKEINLHHIHYNYPNTSRTALRDINLTIPLKSTVGLVGSTGCGKTTTVDIILGLLEPQKGTLEIDGKVITEQNSRAWQRSIGYVPQNIYLSDDTVMANIAFGVEPKDINHDMIKKASKIANLHQFVTDELPNQYLTTIGERGVRISGGQRQRIGIARALYHNPKVLVLDEATSALDNQTEQAVMEAINNLNKKITIILIAHRLNTVKNCDIIYKLDKGQIISQGTYSELFQ
ncbi:ABC transporter ATP-binding protein [Candidatus Pelagibacter communis]|uniref:ABC transporter ATP-binding protein n=1 Tax=Pelagibacter ubique TaxID=198252 RepID=UPI00047FF41A|nr:ABC transporter ATP-binding protein [Candidatus Pelagibacter ubique]